MRTHPTTRYYQLKPNASLEALYETIRMSGLHIAALTASKEQKVFYDTFSWQAYARGVAVVKKQRILSLVDLELGQEISSVPCAKNLSSFFPENLPASPLQETLKTCSTIRAFSALCTLETSSNTFRLLNENDKTIAIIHGETLCLAAHVSKPFMLLLKIVPLRGYEEEMAPIMDTVALHAAVTNELTFRDLFLLIMQEAKLQVQGYSTKIQLKLNPEAPIHESARQLLLSTFAIMRLNEEGIKKNIDSEFLHDYRVAIRRTRSVMKQLKGVFAPDEAAYFLALFRDCSKRTNELRDSDVYLLQKERFFNFLPPVLQPSLLLFFKALSTSRRTFHKRFYRYLSSPGYHASLHEWELFINRTALPEPEKAPNAPRPTKEIALENIKKAWKKVLRNGRAVSRETTDAELHALRIDCKRLRYLLEFFASIFQQESMVPVLRQLKALQENLGDFVDLAVQRRLLFEQLDAMQNDKLLAASIGGLMTTLYQQQEGARLIFHKTFRAFDHEETTQLVHALLTETPI